MTLEDHQRNYLAQGKRLQELIDLLKGSNGKRMFGEMANGKFVDQTAEMIETLELQRNDNFSWAANCAQLIKLSGR